MPLNMEEQNVIDKYLDPIDHNKETKALLKETGLDADFNLYNSRPICSSTYKDLAHLTELSSNLYFASQAVVV